MSSEHADVVIVGSGFGGSVSAHRLAQAGLSVVVLERGKAYAPGGFARTPAEMRRNFWDPQQRTYGLFDVLEFSGFDSIVSSGLGGGSLIYANVLLRKDEHWFVRDEPVPGGGYETWPVTRADLDPHYDAVERMLTPSPYPFEHPVYTDTPKTQAMREAADALGMDWRLPPLAVSFSAQPGGVPRIGVPVVQPAYGNLHGARRATCRLCGECDVGCNDGAKNSLDHTYLSAAKAAGADLRTLCEVQALRPGRDGSYEIRYLRHDTDGSAVSMRINCDRLVLAAGAFGTTRLLLGNRARLPGLSDALGSRFSGNGDVIAFLLRARKSGQPRPLHASKGPVITSTLRVPDQLDGEGGAGRGFYLQDAGYPMFLDWLVQGLDLPGQVARVAGFAANRLRSLVRGSSPDDLEHGIGELLGSGSLSVSSLPLLGMGRDVPDGVMRLRGGELDVSWTTATSRAYYDRVRATMREIAKELDGDYLDNPMWLRRRTMVAHPLGGAPIGRHPGEGVCDPYGEVFGHPGLYVADGAAMPGPVGTNPSLTIAAMADRLCDNILAGGKPGRAPAREGPRRSGETAQTTLAVPARLSGGRAGTATSMLDPASRSSAISFTEEMTGDVLLGGREAPAELSFRLTVTATDLDRFLDSEGHEARARGSVACGPLGGRRTVTDGVVNLLVGDGDHRWMLYRLPFADMDGRELVLLGHKDLRVGPPTSIWPDTTTLHVRLMHGAEQLGSGVLRLGTLDFVRQLSSVRTGGPAPLKTLERFGVFFLSSLWDVYGPRLSA
jgi:cholesterol oxidase